MREKLTRRTLPDTCYNAEEKKIRWNARSDKICSWKTDDSHCNAGFVTDEYERLAHLNAGEKTGRCGASDPTHADLCHKGCQKNEIIRKKAHDRDINTVVVVKRPLPFVALWTRWRHVKDYFCTSRLPFPATWMGNKVSCDHIFLTWAAAST